VLARTFEATGLSTILVTNMPFWVERVGAPRTLAVEFPFGHALGQPHNAAQQMRVIRQALEVLETAQAPGMVVHSPERWPVPQKEALKEWQPSEASPLMKVMAPRFLQMMRERRRQPGADIS
jgi:D-proline reductase (dithiol) PrdB